MNAQKISMVMTLQRVSMQLKLPDAAFARFEDAVGCSEHASFAREYSDLEGASNYDRWSDFHERFGVLGPIHLDARTGRDRDQYQRYRAV